MRTRVLLVEDHKMVRQGLRALLGASPDLEVVGETADGAEAQKLVEELKADLVLFAMGYIHPVHEGMLDELGVKYDARGNVASDTETYQTSVPKVFAAGDTRRGQSLVVWAIREGRQCARAIDESLMGASELPR